MSPLSKLEDGPPGNDDRVPHEGGHPKQKKRRRRQRHRRRRERRQRQRGWPAETVDEDVFMCIVSFLSRGDIASLRLVNHEFADKLKRSLFGLFPVVVPFDIDFYSLTEPTTEKVDIFESIGGCISRFGVSLELDEATFFCPPNTENKRVVDGPTGHYLWIDHDAPESSKPLRIENAGSQMSRMRQAFSFLTNTTHLALSLDTGHGWLEPPTLVRDMFFFKKPRNIFRPEERPATNVTPELYGVGRQSRCLDLEITSRLEPGDILQYQMAALSLNNPYDPDGNLITRHPEINIPFPYRQNTKPALYPDRMSLEQIQWLRQTMWAVRSFLTSYICVVIDNVGVFKQVHTLRLSCFSSSLLVQLDRDGFFESLPRLQHLLIMVIPDWRDTDVMSRPGHEVTRINPGNACLQFTNLLSKRVCRLRTLRQLTVGYLGGGEFAGDDGSRYRHILPAPISMTPRDDVIGKTTSAPLTFPFVQKLAFKNCWLSPRVLERFLQLHQHAALESLEFETCSLTAIPSDRPSPIIKAPAVHGQDDYFHETVRPGTWATILDKFTPSLSLAEQRKNAYMTGKAVERPPKLANLRRIEFRSCGYVRIGRIFNQCSLVVQWDQFILDHFRPAPEPVNPPVPAPAPNSYIIFPAGGAHDRALWESAEVDVDDESEKHLGGLLGTIVNVIGGDEELVLECGFGMRLYDPENINKDDYDDGLGRVGPGRFSGVLSRPDNES